MFLDWKNQYRENDCITQSNLQIQWNLYETTNSILQRTRIKIFITGLETQKTPNIQISLEKEKQSCMNQLS